MVSPFPYILAYLYRVLNKKARHFIHTYVQQGVLKLLLFREIIEKSRKVSIYREYWNKEGWLIVLSSIVNSAKTPGDRRTYKTWPDVVWKCICMVLSKIFKAKGNKCQIAGCPKNAHWVGSWPDYRELKQLYQSAWSPAYIRVLDPTIGNWNPVAISMNTFFVFCSWPDYRELKN